jgi:hypothetical protein
MRFLVLLLTLILASATSTPANLYPSQPLTQVPAPEEVFAFASQPPTPTPEQTPPLAPSRQMSREDLLLFLRNGAIDPLSATPKPDDEGVTCSGVFFTRKGAAYFWSLCNSQTLILITTDYRSCYLRLDHARVHSKAVPRGPDEFHPLQPPPAKEVLSFANADRPGTGFQLLRSKDYVLHFLREGKTLHYGNFFDRFQISNPARVTLPASLVKRFEAFGITFPDQRVKPLESDLEIAGVFATKDGQVYFWEQWGDDVIQISDTSGAECALKLPSAGKAQGHASPKSKVIPAK